jgi:dihydroorotate dehydrogenase
VIGVGGILDPVDAVRLVDAGASLVQLYTGFVYRGPALIRDTVAALATRIPRTSESSRSSDRSHWSAKESS